MDELARLPIIFANELTEIHNGAMRSGSIPPRRNAYVLDAVARTRARYDRKLQYLAAHHSVAGMAATLTAIEGEFAADLET